MRLVIAGAGHWHRPLFFDPARNDPDIRVVGVTDHRPEVARALAAQLGCAGGPDLGELLERVRPDAVFVLGRHADMALHARTLIDARIPFIIEKPGGMTGHAVAGIAEAARTAGVFAAVPLVVRSTGFTAILQDILDKERPVYAAFKFIAGLPERYRDNGCDWMLERTQAGGGVLTNLGVHYLDLMSLIFSGATPEPVSAEFANLSGVGDVEDLANVGFRFGAGRGRVETGYLFPAPTGTFDMHYSVRTERHYVTVTGPGLVTVTDLNGRQTRHETSTTNMEIYPSFLRDTLARLRDGRPPVADLDDLARAMRMVDAAYDLGRVGDLQAGPDR